MTEWLPLDPAGLSDANADMTAADGVQIRLSLSPYDIPDAVRGHYDQSLGRFVLEFRYIQEEEWTRERHDDHLTLRLGRNSGRLYAIEVDVKGLNAKTIGLQLTVSNLVAQAIGTLSSEQAHSRRKPNYRVVKSVVKEHSPQLFRELVPAGS